MKQHFNWYYRRLLAAVAYARWLMFREQPEYPEGARVIIRLRSALYGPEEVLCRISSITYRFYSLTYDVIVLEDKGWLSFGTRTFVFPENIVGKERLQSRHTTS